MIALGIDPGRCGAVVALSIGDDGIRSVYQVRTPALMSGAEYLPDRMRGALVDAGGGYRTVAVLERCGAMPGQGVSSCYAFGHARGLWRGLLAGLGWEVLEPTPARWHRTILADIPGEGKAKAIARASQIAGLDLIPRGCRVPQDGLADAACLALFGLREGR